MQVWQSQYIVVVQLLGMRLLSKQLLSCSSPNLALTCSSVPSHGAHVARFWLYAMLTQDVGVLMETPIYFFSLYIYILSNRKIFKLYLIKARALII